MVKLKSISNQLGKQRAVPERLRINCIFKHITTSPYNVFIHLKRLGKETRVEKMVREDTNQGFREDTNQGFREATNLAWHHG